MQPEPEVEEDQVIDAQPEPEPKDQLAADVQAEPQPEPVSDAVPASSTSLEPTTQDVAQPETQAYLPYDPLPEIELPDTPLEQTQGADDATAGASQRVAELRSQLSPLSEQDKQTEPQASEPLTEMKLGDILPSPEAPEQTEPVKQDTAPDLQSLPATEEQTDNSRQLKSKPTRMARWMISSRRKAAKSTYPQRRSAGSSGG